MVVGGMDRPGFVRQYAATNSVELSRILSMPVHGNTVPDSRECAVPYPAMPYPIRV